VPDRGGDSNTHLFKVRHPESYSVLGVSTTDSWGGSEQRGKSSDVVFLYPRGLRVSSMGGKHTPSGSGGGGTEEGEAFGKRGLHFVFLKAIGGLIKGTFPYLRIGGFNGGRKG